MLCRIFRPIDWYYSLRGGGGGGFLETFPIIAIHSPRSSEFDAVRGNIFVLGKTRD